MLPTKIIIHSADAELKLIEPTKGGGIYEYTKGVYTGERTKITDAQIADKRLVYWEFIYDQTEEQQRPAPVAEVVKNHVEFESDNIHERLKTANLPSVKPGKKNPSSGNPGQLSFF